MIGRDGGGPGVKLARVAHAGRVALSAARVALGASLIALALWSCTARGTSAHATAQPSQAFNALPAADAAFLDTLSRRTFDWFWDLSDARTGLTPDRWPTKSFVSVGAVGFALTAYPLGVERGWITREQASERVLRTLEFFWTAKQDTARSGVTGYRGFFYHFLDPTTGVRFEQVELSTMDTALMLAGALYCQSWFDGRDASEERIRALADSIYFRADWQWAAVRPPTIALGWNPEQGHLPWDWRGYNETMILHVLALGSPTHPADSRLWSEYAAHDRWGTFHGQEHVGFAPLFGHQYSHLWIDFRGIQDPLMREKGIDYFENSRRATLAQRAYAMANPGGFRDYGARAWGLTACDGPVSAELEIAGRKRKFDTYTARGASFTEVIDDGTISPSAAGGSIAFAPAECAAVLRAMRMTYGDALFGRYGFVDAFNPTLDVATRVQHGKIVPGVGWFDTDYLGIDQGPILGMIENLRAESVWKKMRTNAHIVRGLRRAGFTGGWLDRAPKTP